jgi:hypothetical protein
MSHILICQLDYKIEVMFQAQLELRILVPVGNSDHGTLVMVTTALTLVLATLFLLWTIQASAKKNR